MNFWPFQSTLPQRERRMIVPDQWTSLRHFNPRSRKGSDPRNGILHPASSDISIHAPAKGATINFLCCCNSAGISIHAPAKGATRSSCFGLRYISNFNPRSRKGSDPTMRFRHARKHNFNPRSRKGSDGYNHKTRG